MDKPVHAVEGVPEGLIANVKLFESYNSFNIHIWRYNWTTQLAILGAFNFFWLVPFLPTLLVRHVEASSATATCRVSSQQYRTRLLREPAAGAGDDRAVPLARQARLLCTSVLAQGLPSGLWRLCSMQARDEVLRRCHSH